jgi:hypothetical protein
VPYRRRGLTMATGRVAAHCTEHAVSWVACARERGRCRGQAAPGRCRGCGDAREVEGRHGCRQQGRWGRARATAKGSTLSFPHATRGAYGHGGGGDKLCGSQGTVGGCAGGAMQGWVRSVAVWRSCGGGLHETRRAERRNCTEGRSGLRVSRGGGGTAAAGARRGMALRFIGVHEVWTCVAPNCCGWQHPDSIWLLLYAGRVARPIGPCGLASCKRRG